MSTLPMTQVTDSNPIIRQDYTLDYRGSNLPAQLPLELLDVPTREAAFAGISDDLAVPINTLRDIFTNVVAGKHILLYGPPGTGKTTLASMIAQRLFNCDVHRETAVADWTTFETAGGLQLELRADGTERLAPRAGVITEQVVACLNAIGTSVMTGTGPQGAWLVIDELNRANMDSAFGPFFTALDQDHPEVSLPFFDPPRQVLWVPRRFRIIGTMNTFDKNFLFRLSYALTRRFALISIDVPNNTDQPSRDHERQQLWRNITRGVRERIPGAENRTEQEIQAVYNTTLMTPLYDTLVPYIRESQPNGLGRGIGFAQIASALRHAVFEVELGLVAPDQINQALDRGIRSAIVPQLEGLPSSTLQQFIDWWAAQPALAEMTYATAAVRELLRGASLFRTE